MRNRESGFTLVEIAIVLVIISLLLGGILKGQELINSTKIKGNVNDFRSTATAYYGFQDRFKAVAGDDTAVATHVTGGTLATTPTGDTRGNGRIGGWWIPATVASDESSLFWQHVRLAGFLTGTTTVATGYGPVNASGGQIGITGTNPDSTAASTFGGTFYVCSNNIDGKSAKLIDIAMDDGATNTGTVRVFAADAAAAGPLIAITAIVDGTLYSVCAAY